MKKTILTFLFIGILVSPISASAMNRNEVENQYREALMTLIILLTQQVNELMRQLEGMQFDMLPVENPKEIINKVEPADQSKNQEEPKVEEPVEWVRPYHGEVPAKPKPTSDRCHAPGQLDIRIKCE